MKSISLDKHKELLDSAVNKKEHELIGRFGILRGFIEALLAIKEYVRNKK